MLNTPEFKVGALVVIVSGLIGVMSLKVAQGPSLFGGAKKYDFELEDAGGLVKNSSVKMAGIKVGVIDDIELKDGKAKVHLLINDDVPMTTSAKAIIKSDGILGDKHVELFSGSTTDKPLDGGAIEFGGSKGSLDKVMSQVSEIAESLKEVAKVVEAAAKDGERSTSLGRIVSNIEKLTQDLADISGRNKEKINDIVDQVHGITETLDDLINDDSPDGFKKSWAAAMSGLKRLDATLKNAEEITGKINRGEGTIGRLVNDEETVDGINQAVNNVNEFLGGATAMETSLDFHSEYITQLAGAKSYLNLKIQPGLDRYYLLGIVDDPAGVTRVSETKAEQAGRTTDVVETKTFRDQIKFTALFAKNFYDVTIKGGIMENSGGVGVDYHLFNKKLDLSVEAFEFKDLHLRAFLKYQFVRGIYLVGGGDDLADKTKASGFVGGGIFITNDDLKTLAGKLSF